MNAILVGTASGCRVFGDDREERVELEGRSVGALAASPEGNSPDGSSPGGNGPGGTCVAVVDGGEVMRRSAQGEWSSLATTEHELVSVACAGERVLAGTIGDASLVEVSGAGTTALHGFAEVAGRDTWFGEGPPLHVRSIAVAPDATILAAVHVGGIARSTGGTETWLPTIPIEWDVHEVCAHRTSNLVAAATAVGLAVSEDAGESWMRFAEGPAVIDSLAVAALDDEILFSVQDGPFPDYSQVWRWAIGGTSLEQVRDGLPEWLDGKVDTMHIATGGGRAAIVDGGGTLWLSGAGSRDWRELATGLNPAFSVQML